MNSNCTHAYRFHTIAGLYLVVLYTLLSGTGYAQLPGKDGSVTIGSSNTVVNHYYVLMQPVTTGNSTLTLHTASGLSTGDLLMIYQAKGATIGTANDISFGEVLDYNGAGNVEFRGVASVSGNTVTLSAPLTQSYSTTGKTQVVRIPQYSELTVSNGASIVARAWNGLTGGIVAVSVSGTLTLHGRIRADGAGFRGGELSVNGGSVLQSNTLYRTTSVADGAVKGESIADSALVVSAGRYGRGAAANGGGGGNNHNAGGGGGANGMSPSTWTGQGVMCTSCSGASAWSLDPAGANANSSGGGRGGYSYSASNRDALLVGPGISNWGGDYRQERGGLGGRPLVAIPESRVFFGGGGGAGHQNNSCGGAGGNGGGFVFVQATAISGSGRISANGNNGGATTGNGNDGPGGAGAGGSILLDALSISGIQLSADGGVGGNQIINYNFETEGPGGGGGGGFIATRMYVSSMSVNGGANGTTSSPSLSEFPANGATSGAAGTIELLTASPLPVELVSFSARKRGGVIELHWTTATELNNYGFEVERSVDKLTWETLQFVAGNGTTFSPRSYSWSDASSARINTRKVLWYRLRQIDRDGSTEYSPAISVAPTADAALSAIEAYPNPMIDQAVVSFALAGECTVSLTVYNMLGQEVARLVDGESMSAGTFTSILHANNLLPGNYIIRLIAGDAASITMLRKQ